MQMYFWQVTGKDWQDVEQPAEAYRNAKRKHERFLPHDKVREQKRDRSERDRDGEVTHTYSAKKAARDCPEARERERLREQAPHRRQHRNTFAGQAIAVDSFRGARILPGSKSVGGNWGYVFADESKLPCRRFAWPHEKDQNTYASMPTDVRVYRPTASSDGRFVWPTTSLPLEEWAGLHPELAERESVVQQLLAEREQLLKKTEADERQKMDERWKRTGASDERKKQQDFNQRILNQRSLI